MGTYCKPWSPRSSSVKLLPVVLKNGDITQRKFRNAIFVNQFIKRKLDRIIEESEYDCLTECEIVYPGFHREYDRLSGGGLKCDTSENSDIFPRPYAALQHNAGNKSSITVDEEIRPKSKNQLQNSDITVRMDSIQDRYLINERSNNIQSIEVMNCKKSLKEKNSILRSGSNEVREISKSLSLDVKYADENEEEYKSEGKFYPLKKVKSSIDIYRLYGGCLRNRDSDEIEGEKESSRSHSTDVKIANNTSLEIKVKGLEDQIQQLIIDLRDMREQLVPLQEIRKNTERLNEIGALLEELKNNFFQLQKVFYDERPHSSPSKAKNFYSNRFPMQQEHLNHKHPHIPQKYSEVRNPNSMQVTGNNDLENPQLNFKPKLNALYDQKSKSRPHYRKSEIDTEPTTSLKARYQDQIRCNNQTECHMVDDPCSSHYSGGRHCQWSYPRAHSTALSFNENMQYQQSHNDCGQCRKRRDQYDLNFEKEHILDRSYAGNNGNTIEIDSDPFTKNLPHSTAYKNDEINAVHPIISDNLSQIIFNKIGKNDSSNIALTVLLDESNLYQINVSATNTGQSLAEVYATQEALQVADQNGLFEKFLTFFVINSKTNSKDNNQILGHSFKFMNIENEKLKGQYASKSKSDSSARYQTVLEEEKFVTPQSSDDVHIQTSVKNITKVDVTKGHKELFAERLENLDRQIQELHYDLKGMARN
ncbi:uncharacterized protein LOC142226631 [Haematobia irritans]|uniref:uncharacterized protein LOC142226631 n=1 Tax=Haematobia irritans TaxID=7368 RepID=UPI003F50076C